MSGQRYEREASPPTAVDVYPSAASATLSVRQGPIGDFGEPIATLRPAQLQRLRQALANGAIPDSLTGCFVPHHRFDFMDAAGKKVGEILVCFCCFQVAANPQLVTSPHRMLIGDYEALSSLVSELGSSANTNCDEQVP